MAESEWQHASWVSSLGKWAWIILILWGIISIILNLILILPTIALWEYARSLWVLAFPGTPYTVPHPIVELIWPIIGAIILLAVSFIIIRPKFSKPCGNKDWDALYSWTLKLGGFNIPWMLIWGIILELFSWYYVGGLVVLIPAVMLLFVGPKEYKWSEEKAPK